MKSFSNSIFALVLLVSGTLFTTSCRKNAEEVQALVTDSEAAEILETTISERSAGMTVPTTEMAEIATESSLDCGLTNDTSFQVSKTVGLNSYSRNFNLQWTVNCTQFGVPENALFNVSGSGTFGSANWTGNTTADGALTFTGLSLQQPNYTAYGTYNYAGTLQGDLRRTDPTLSCVATITMDNLTISKATNEITSGSGSATLTVTSASGQTASFTGTVVYNGNGTVTVVVNGHTHTFQLN